MNAFFGRAAAVCAILGLVLACPACSDDGSGDDSCADDNSKLSLEKKAALSVSHVGAAAKPLYSFDASSLSGPKAYAFVVSNTASALSARPLTITEIDMVETDGKGKIVSNSAFSCLHKGKSCADTTWGVIIPDGYDKACIKGTPVSSEEFMIRYDHGGVQGERKLLVRLWVEGDPEYKDKPLEVRFSAAIGSARLECSPAIVDFGKIAAGKGATEEIKCTSIGSAPVVIAKAELFSKTDPPLTVGMGGWILSLKQPYTGKPEIVIPPGKALAMHATLTALGTDEPVGATMHIFSNDPSKDKVVVQMLANQTGPCFKLKPGSHDFGDVPVGGNEQIEVQLLGCGTEPAVLESVALDAGSAGDFQLDFSESTGKAPTKDNPLVVQPNGLQKFKAMCKPSTLGKTLTGKIKLVSKDGTERFMALSCTPVDLCKPTALIDVKPGTTVIPQTPLTLSAGPSKACPGQALTGYKWTVSQPNGSVATFSPNDAAKIVGLVPNVSGTYTFGLTVSDASGTKSEPAKVKVEVLPDNKLHVELTWVQLGDKNKGDKKGSDLDLHLAHPLASQVKGQGDLDQDGKPDPWYAQCYDCFWFNCKPGGNNKAVWGSLADLDDDATVDLDDTDGWGPENISIKYPEQKVNGKEAWYTIGVYVFSDVGMGPSVPKVRVFLDSLEVFNKKGPPMVTKDMWCAAKVKWDGTAAAADVKKCFSGQGKELRPKYPFKTPSFKCPAPLNPP